MNKIWFLAVIMILILSTTVSLGWSLNHDSNTQEPEKANVNDKVSWDIQIVDENAAGIGSGYCPIALDSNDIPHIAYSGKPSVRYTSWNGTGWETQQIAYGFALDLELDASDTPYIVYDGVYANWTGKKWNSKTITIDNPTYASLALDSCGNPHIAYVYGGELKYAYRNSSESVIQTVVTDSDLPGIFIKLSLALDSNNVPHIMYYTRSYCVDNVTGRSYHSIIINYAVLENSGWNIETVIASNTVVLGNMVLDSNGYAHFTCTQYQHFEDSDVYYTIAYVHWNGSAWNTQTAASNVSSKSGGFLALDDNDCLHLCYFTVYPEKLVYSRWSGTSWERYIVDDDTLDNLSDKPYYLALDSEGNPHISYLKFSQLGPTVTELTYTTAKIPDAPPLSVSIISPASQTYSTTNVSLTFAANEQASFAYYSLDGGANVSVTGNTTLANLANGAHNLTLYVEDDIGNIGVTETIVFTIAKDADFLQSILLISVVIIVAALVVYVWKNKTKKTVT